MKVASGDGAPVDLSSLTGLKPNDLQSLRLEYTKITDADLSHLRGLTGLNELELKSTAVTGEGFVYLRNLKLLIELGLWETPIDNAGLKHLREFTASKSLILE